MRFCLLISVFIFSSVNFVFADDVGNIEKVIDFMGKIYDKDSSSYEGKDAYLMCCDEQGHYYSKKSRHIVHVGKMITADGETYIRSKYCKVRAAVFEDGNDKPTNQQECINVMLMIGPGPDSGSMYGD